ncbi:L-rhamnose mutarotase [Glaciihabitans sp. INWT7]|uniref:L-rhamnose mutarotase n=1 Tax=Glaciihabitans sp. INWT7 TaxID=2596912 RepID=UPI001627F8A3|nr:L-rhamnose mutarotase [Glaciihabitans sp. INWT7]QNE45582.1 L-rhamnose mutarotase [Glaciihabitans sp. INWT7]
MRRVCFQLQVKLGHIDAYRVAHAAVWAEMLEALHDTGWRNYSIFLRDDGLVIGYFETEDLQANLDGMAAAPVNARWQAAMAEHFVDLDVPADQAFLYLDEVFNLDDQLTSLRTNSVNQNGNRS